jgi:hypothetical protein
VIDLRRALLLSLLATAGCGPTSDWPLSGEGKDDDSTSKDAGVPRMDAGANIDAGRSSDCDASDAGDAGADAACDIVISD